jgi:hypothetical protein
MTFNKLPKIEEKQIKSELESIVATIKDGQLQKWLDTQLESLHQSNPKLYEYITTRSQLFANGIMSVSREPHSIILSLALEYILLLRVLDSSLAAEESLENFKGLMDKWFGNKGIDGLNNV